MSLALNNWAQIVYMVCQNTVSASIEFSYNHLSSQWKKAFDQSIIFKKVLSKAVVNFKIVYADSH